VTRVAAAQEDVLKSTLTHEAVLHELVESDIEPVIALAQAIWLAYYVPIIGRAQVDYMMAQRFTDANLRRYLGAADRWMDVLTLAGAPVGYCSYALSESPQELKLEQLYVLPEHHGRGLGGLMLRHIEVRARELGQCGILLTVNKHNAGAIAVYRKSGFTLRCEAVFDIGHGYVMDDYVFAKSLA
jgi:ribosomal protein S18 acetylase RimI-like enzyme